MASCQICSGVCFPILKSYEPYMFHLPSTFRLPKHPSVVIKLLCFRTSSQLFSILVDDEPSLMLYSLKFFGISQPCAPFQYQFPALATFLIAMKTYLTHVTWRRKNLFWFIVYMARKALLSKCEVKGNIVYTIK